MSEPVRNSSPGILTEEELRNVWPVLSIDERVEGFELLSRTDAEDFFLSLSTADMTELLLALPLEEQRLWLRLLPPDDAADIIQDAPEEKRPALLQLLDDTTRKEVTGLLAYREDEAGGLMSPRYARVRPDMTVDEAISYLRKQARGQLETIYYIYVLDEQQRLEGVVSLKQLIAAQPEKRVRELMETDLVKVDERMDQEAVSRLFAQHDLLAIPVVDEQGRMKGLVTVDDIVDVVQEEATEDAQKFGGMQALDAPYMATPFWEMIRKRGVWLAVLFLGEMITASAMAYFEDEIARAVVLALFIPLIISSGGNSGSQASTLVIRAMALGEVRLRDWWRVIKREMLSGLVMGSALGLIGFLRVILWHQFRPIYGEHYVLIGLVVFLSLIGVVTFGTVVGSLLPFILRRLGLDPASASAPFVATLVDVSGILIYFSAAVIILSGTLL